MTTKLTNAEIQQINNIFNDEDIDAFNRLYSVNTYLQSLKRSKGQSKIVWLTVNPKPSVSFDDFKKTVQSFLTRTFVHNSAFMFEQRGTSTDTMGNGAHVHILFDKHNNVSPSQITKYTQNSFKNIVGNLKAIDIRFYSSQLRDEKLEYLKGNKWDADKASKVAIDKKWRQKLQL